MRAVLDTNIIVSSYLSHAGPSGSIRAALEQQQFDLVASEELLAEYRHALAYPRIAELHGMRDSEITAQVAGIRQVAVLVPPAEIPNVIPEDPPDNMVIATAVAGNALYIVSGDDDLHRLGAYQGIQVLSPALFLALLRP
jgi:uncharacterized protein